MRVYTVIVPMDGRTDGYPLAECASLTAALDVARSLLSVVKLAPYRLVILVEDRPSDPGWQFPGEVR